MVEHYKLYNHKLLGSTQKVRKKKKHYVGFNGVHASPGKWTHRGQERVHFTETNLDRAEMHRLRQTKQWKDIQDLMKTKTKEEWVEKMEEISNKTYEFQKNEKNRYLEIIGRDGIVRGSKRKRSQGWYRQTHHVCFYYFRQPT